MRPGGRRSRVAKAPESGRPKRVQRNACFGVAQVTSTQAAATNSLQSVYNLAGRRNFLPSLGGVLHKAFLASSERLDANSRRKGKNLDSEARSASANSPVAAGPAATKRDQETRLPKTYGEYPLRRCPQTDFANLTLPLPRPPVAQTSWPSARFRTRLGASNGSRVQSASSPRRVPRSTT